MEFEQEGFDGLIDRLGGREQGTLALFFFLNTMHSRVLKNSRTYNLAYAKNIKRARHKKNYVAALKMSSFDTI